MGALLFEWDDAKNEANVEKHGVSFEEAQTVFFDEDALRFFDRDHSDDEDRFLLVGKRFNLRILMVCHCYRVADRIRIISARKATSRERAVYRKRRR